MIRYTKEQQEQKEEEQTTLEKPSDQMSLSSKIEFIEQKLMKLQSLKEDTVDDLSNLLNERNRESVHDGLFHLCLSLF